MSRYPRTGPTAGTRTARRARGDLADAPPCGTLPRASPAGLGIRAAGDTVSGPGVFFAERCKVLKKNVKPSLGAALACILAAVACETGDRAAPVSAGSGASAVQAPHTTRMTFPVSGMVCEGCENSIRGAVEKLEGVVSCTANHKAQEAVVAFDETRISSAILRETIASLGYKVGDPQKDTAAPPGGPSGAGPRAEGTESQ